MKSFSSRLQITAAYLGNAYEHYDTALYGLLAPYLAPIFFPSNDPLMALILSYALIPLGMLARPIGAFVIGSIGDVYGRQSALYCSLLGMGVVSFGIGLLPDFEKAGWFAPIALTFGRIFQNFFAAGEIMGGAIYVLENSSSKKADLLSSLYNGSTVLGIIFASILVSYLSFQGQVENSWRYLYLIGGGAALVGAFIRFFAQNEPRKTVFGGPSTWSLLFIHKKAVFQIALASGFSYALFSSAFVLTNGMAPHVAHVSKEEMTHLNTALLVFDLAILPFFGLIAAHFERRKWMLAAATAAAVLFLPLFQLLKGAGFYQVALVRCLLVILGVWFSSTLHSWSQQMIAKEHRYRLISFAYALGTQLIGSQTTFLSLTFYQQTEKPLFAAIYVVFLAVCTCLTFTFAKKSEHQTVFS